MTARTKSPFAAISGVLAALGLMLVAGVAIAGGVSTGCGCVTPPSPPCCAPPTPPSPPSFPCCSPPSINVTIPGVNVNVESSVIVNTNVSTQSNVVSQGGATTAFVVGGGGGGGGFAASSPGMIQGLNVENGVQRAAYEATRTKIIKVVIEAVCLDDKDVPHPASQVSPDRDIEDSYEGELFRCIAGTRMQYTFAEFTGKIDFDHGQTITCEKGEALYHSPFVHGGPGGGPMGPSATLACRPQRPARDCNERSLLRRFGAGVKVLTIVMVEKYTAYKEETTAASSGGGLSLDGGVGGITY